MRLAALVHVELQLGVARGELVEKAGQRRRALARSGP